MDVVAYKSVFLLGNNTFIYTLHALADCIQYCATTASSIPGLGDCILWWRPAKDDRNASSIILHRRSFLLALPVNHLFYVTPFWHTPVSDTSVMLSE